MVGTSENGDVLKVSSEADETELMLQGQANIWRHMFAFADSMALKCAVELRIADIIHSHARPITLSQIATCIDSPQMAEKLSTASPILQMAPPRRRAEPRADGAHGEPPLSHGSLALLRDVRQRRWHSLREGHGHQIWDLASEKPEFNKLFNDGGTGGAVAEVVKAYPHIKGINFDLPHVVATAPAYKGVSHVGGDMFESIPNADAIFMKWILHDWNDEDCVKILKNCRKAIPEKTGKVIIVDGVIREDGYEPFDETRLVLDLVMMAHTSHGQERTEVEWKKLLEEGGFPRYRILKIPTLQMIIEAYPV
ncbi:xanthohumol 4'-O-methyltransferase [Vitis vinifera]|uniref:Xanthohumol 4'-O-methyltransferase n=1 Tax=Vitis vinifera TaxID=29760 RepID=A0A438EFD6_VITVI|nr:xanthohumol 4'-O-methyltransferase [Vitis vinifera]